MHLSSRMLDYCLACRYFGVIFTVAERAQRAANRKKKCTANAYNTTKQRNALQINVSIWLCCENFLSVSLFACIVIICSICCQIDDIFLICGCFFYLHVFSEVAACWALLATVYFAVKKYFFPDMISPHHTYSMKPHLRMFMQNPIMQNPLLHGAWTQMCVGNVWTQPPYKNPPTPHFWIPFKPSQSH